MLNVLPPPDDSTAPSPPSFPGPLWPHFCLLFLLLSIDSPPSPRKKVKAFVSNNDPAICARLYTLDMDVAKAAPAEDKAQSLCSVLKATLQAGSRVSVQDQACLWLEARPPPPSYMPFRFLESPQQSELLQKSAVS